MGIPQIWPSIDEAWQTIDNVPKDLYHKRLAIDISIWFHEAVKGVARHQNRNQCASPVLTLVDARIRKLQELHVKLVAVFDGPKIDAKKKKTEVVSKILLDTQIMNQIDAAAMTTKDGESSTSGESLVNPSPRRKPRTPAKPKPNTKCGQGKARLTATQESKIYKEVKKLLLILDVAIVQAPGEAEAQCAHMELEGLVDGTITKDFDYFLFGGRTMYRIDFARHLARPPVEKLIIDDIALALESPLSTIRDDLIACALLIGCDYCEGVGGFGARKSIYHVWHIRDKCMQLQVETPQKHEFGRVHEVLWSMRHYYEMHDRRSAHADLRRFVGMNLIFPTAFPDVDIIRLFERPHVGVVYEEKVAMLALSTINEERLTLFKEVYMAHDSEKTADKLRKDKKRAKDNKDAALQMNIWEFAKAGVWIENSELKVAPAKQQIASSPVRASTPKLTKMLDVTPDLDTSIMATPTKRREEEESASDEEVVVHKSVAPRLQRPRPTAKSKPAAKPPKVKKPVAVKNRPPPPSHSMLKFMTVKKSASVSDASSACPSTSNVRKRDEATAKLTPIADRLPSTSLRKRTSPQTESQP